MNENVPVSDTPVTHLSKILSKTCFTESSRNYFPDKKLSQISEHIPADIDESANQEAPISSAVWCETQELIIHEGSNSCSSGYYSSATHSAPPTCDFARDSKLDCFQTDVSGYPITIKLSTTADIKRIGSNELRRTHSCTTRGWLNKRQRKNLQWPRISGISKSKDTNSSFHLREDSNSCPAAITGSQNDPNSVKRYYLPPVGEIGSSSSSNDTSRGHSAFEDFSIDDGNIGESRCDPSMDFSFYPAHKKQRISSPIVPELSSPVKIDVDTTLSLAEQSIDSDVNVELVSDLHHARPKPFFGLLRHHSTPMPTHMYKVENKSSPNSSTEVCPNIPPNKPTLSRCLSDNTSTIYDKLTKCISALDNHSLRSDGRRPRALPVVDRTASGLHCVTTDTVAELVCNTSHKKVNFVIVDCRFPYEYEGGHIKGAINIFTHSDLVKEIFDRVPAQRPPGSSGPPRLLGEGLARRLAMTQREPLSAPCELISDESDDDDNYERYENSTSDASELELRCNAGLQFEDNILEQSIHSTTSKSEPDLSHLSNSTSMSSDSSSQETPFIVIFHCEFSSQRAPALATFLRSVDRVSNYHRYPFLYFPEIYVMKGGYSAFYQKFPHMCCPQAYVKMFHRSYRNHLRLYKRLTRRVSSACLACIRPIPQQNPELRQHDLPMNEFDSFAQIPANPKLIEKKDQFDLPIIFGTSPSFNNSILLSTNDNAKHVQLDIDGNDKENKSPSVSQSEALSSAHIANQQIWSNKNINDNNDDPTSPSDQIISTNEQEHGSLVDSPLNLAEVVIRVGQQVIAATLCNADPATSEIARTLDQFKKRITVNNNNDLLSNELVDNIKCKNLKRSLTTNNILDIKHNNICNNNEQLKHLKQCLITFNDDDNSCLQNTPDLKRISDRPMKKCTPLCKNLHINKNNHNLLDLTNSSNILQTPVISNQNSKHIPNSHKNKPTNLTNPLNISSPSIFP